MSHLAQRHTVRRTVSNNPPIANEINAATRVLHTQLNKLIVDRLPLGLPPSAPSPSRYAAGLRRFAIIFLALEHALKAVAQHVDKGHDIADMDDHQAAVMRWIADLAPPALLRTPRLEADLDHLQALGYKALPPAYGQANLTRLIDEAIKKPHVLVAYAWVMYMAIFSGGRWIRQQLSSAGPAFWLGIDEAAGLHIDDLPGFSFLSFGTADDGEALKASFKAHLLAADDLLTAEERQEIVSAGVSVFEQCIQLVEQIDRDVWWQESSTSWPLAVAILIAGLLYIGWLFYSGRSIFLD